MGMRRTRDLFRDEMGLTTVSMAVSIFLALALIFSAGQLYRVSSASADIQEVADASAMAAQIEVSRYMSIANGCDAVLFTMTLTTTVVMAVGVVAACIPPAAAVSERLIACGRRIANARDTAAERMADALNVLQQALPFIAAVKAANVASRNDLEGMASQYHAVTLLVPMAGQPIDVSSDGLSALVDTVEEEAPGIRSAAARAEELAQKANESKTEAYMADCGNNPGYCMYERAGSLAYMAGGTSNQYYSSIDAWSFKAALERTHAYYRSRYIEENAFMDSSLSMEDRADSVLRGYFYKQAFDDMTAAVASAGEQCTFPQLFRNLDEMRATPLYTAALFPVTQDGDTMMMHAWDGCPGAAGAGSLGSVSQLEGGGYTVCSYCELTASTFGNVASASTAISNGFEYHYNIVREANERYNQAMDELEPVKEEVEGSVGSIFQDIGDVLSGGAGSKRIHADPPGSAGAIALVVNAAQNDASTGFESSFVGGGATLGTRAAVAGASLQIDEDAPDTTIMDEVLDGLSGAISGSDAAARTVGDLWTSFVRAWGSGQQSIVDTVREGVDSVDIATASGLGSWAAGALNGLIEGLGLEPPALFKLRPVLVNTAYVAGADSSELSVRYLQVKEAALSASSGSTGLFSGLAAGIRSALGLDAGVPNSVQISMPVGDMDVPITLAIPSTVQEGAQAFVNSAIDGVAQAAASTIGDRSWQ